MHLLFSGAVQQDLCNQEKMIIKQRTESNYRRYLKHTVRSLKPK